jgi:hypothetical protein
VLWVPRAHAPVPHIEAPPTTLAPATLRTGSGRRPSTARAASMKTFMPVGTVSVCTSSMRVYRRRILVCNNNEQTKHQASICCKSSLATHLSVRSQSLDRPVRRQPTHTSDASIPRLHARGPPSKPRDRGSPQSLCTQIGVIARGTANSSARKDSHACDALARRIFPAFKQLDVRHPVDAEGLPSWLSCLSDSF